MSAPNETLQGYDIKTDELVGSLFFKANVAISLTQAEGPYGLLKSDVYRFLQSYNYDSAGQYLRTVGVDRVSKIDTEPRKAVFQLLGFICRSFPASSSYKVMQQLLSYARENPVVARANSTNRALSGTCTPLQGDHEALRRESELEDRLPRYTSTLYEEGSRRNIVIHRTFLVLSQEPSRVKATVSFGALEATSIGRTRKIAGHTAAKEICDKLNFTIQLS